VHRVLQSVLSADSRQILAAHPRPIANGLP
jgi:hypothetical protein